MAVAVDLGREAGDEAGDVLGTARAAHEARTDSLGSLAARWTRRVLKRGEDAIGPGRAELLADVVPPLHGRSPKSPHRPSLRRRRASARSTNDSGRIRQSARPPSFVTFGCGTLAAIRHVHILVLCSVTLPPPCYCSRFRARAVRSLASSTRSITASARSRSRSASSERPGTARATRTASRAAERRRRARSSGSSSGRSSRSSTSAAIGGSLFATRSHLEGSVGLDRHDEAERPQPLGPFLDRLPLQGAPLAVELALDAHGVSMT